MNDTDILVDHNDTVSMPILSSTRKKQSNQSTNVKKRIYADYVDQDDESKSNTINQMDTSTATTTTTTITTPRAAANFRLARRNERNKQLINQLQQRVNNDLRKNKQDKDVEMTKQQYYSGIFFFFLIWSLYG